VNEILGSNTHIDPIREFQEAVSVGMESAITHEDKVITAYRCHPFAVLRGGTIHNVLAELLGE
jgi:pyruvate dehydrogenase E1 component alpha subunit